jgi:hypothetical protein
MMDIRWVIACAAIFVASAINPGMVNETFDRLTMIGLILLPFIIIVRAIASAIEKKNRRQYFAALQKQADEVEKRQREQEAARQKYWDQENRKIAISLLPDKLERSLREAGYRPLNSYEWENRRANIFPDA